MKKAIRILSTILVLSIITALYCIIIAPLLEPDSKYQKIDLPNNEFPISSPQIMTLFNQNDWEVNSSRHLNYNNIHFYVGDYTILDPESIKFDKGAIVFLLSENPIKAIVVQCMGAITLNFEKPITHGLKGGNRLLGGKLTGKIRVASKGDGPGFSFETQDFNIDKDRVWTKANVHFKYDRTQGYGSGMQIQLINHGLFGSQNNSPDSTAIAPRIENVTIQKLQRLTIVPPDKKKTDSNNEQSDFLNSPIELRCDGPFTFNALSKNASFEQNVSLIQTVSNRAPNSIRCQNLYLYFASASRKNSEQQNNDPTSQNDSYPWLGEWDLQVERLEAVGSPVVIEAPEYQTKINASRFTANLSPLSFDLDSTNQQCEIHYKNSLISTQNIVYTIGNPGTLGTLECNCSGWISSQMEQNGKQIRARWTDRLRLEPVVNDPSESIVSIQGSARLEIENNNKPEAAITSNGIFFWLTQKAKSSSNEFGELVLTRMKADENVVMKSNPITAKVNTLQLWFENSEGEAESGNRQEIAGISSQAPQEPLSQFAANSYSVSGNLLRGKILLGRGSFQISELTLRENVRVVQNNPASNGNANNGRLEMKGAQIQAFNLTLPSVTASLIGQPAVILYNNTMFTGSSINVNRGISKIWMESGGEALFMPQEGGEAGAAPLAESSLASPGSNSSLISVSSAVTIPTKIAWSNSMAFQNDTLTFNGNVTLERKDQFAQCDTLSVLLNKKLDFQNLNSEEWQKSLDVRSVVLNNSVKLENYISENGVTVAMDCLTASTLTIDVKNQSFVAEGPGKAMTQRKMSNGEQTAPDSSLSRNSEPEAERNSQETLVSSNDSPAAYSLLPTASPLPAPNSLVNLSVKFQKKLEGLFSPHSQSTFTFSGNVVAEYSPIDKIGKEINTFIISELPPEAFTLRCNKMEIQTELGANDEKRAARNSGFIASDGVSVEGRVYNASADKITFEAKNGIMTLEGDGQIPAQFYYQKVLGGRRNQASSSVIYYNTQTGAVKGEGIQEFSLFLAPKIGGQE